MQSRCMRKLTCFKLCIGIVIFRVSKDVKLNRAVVLAGFDMK